MAPNNPNLAPRTGKVQRVVDTLKDFVEYVGLRKPLPLPVVHKRNLHYTKVRSYVDKKGNKRYWCSEKFLRRDINGDGKITDTGVVSKSGKKDHEGRLEKQFLIWYFKAQILAYSEDINDAEKKIRAYKREIAKIDKFISRQKTENLKREVQQVQLSKKIKQKRRWLRSKKRAGSLESDPDIKAIRSEISRLNKKLGKIQLNNKFHFTNWPEAPTPYPGSNKSTNRNLYLHRVTLKRKINYFKKHELEVAKEQLKRSVYHLRRTRK